MNRIYEVIWNKSKNSCSVVSEMAKNLGKTSGCRNKAVLAAMILSLLSAGGLAYAENPATPPAAPDKKIPYFSVNANNSAKPAGTNWNNDGAKGAAAIAVGKNAVAQGKHGAAVGSSAQAGGDQSSAFGVAANASGRDAIAAGSNTVAGAANASAFGAAANATGESATAVGAFADASGERSLAAGDKAKASANRATALGYMAKAEGVYSLAAGYGSSATGEAAYAFGVHSKADGGDAIAIGSASEAQKDGGIAIGSTAIATQEFGVALGAGSIADRDAGVSGYLAGDDTSKAWQATVAAVAIGNEEEGFTRQITGVAAGTKDTDAVNVVQLKKLASNVNEKMTGLDTRITTNTANIIANTENITVLNGRVDQLDTRVDRIGAGAAALAGLHPLDYDPENKWDFAASYGNYNGANAVAVGAFYRPTANRMFSVGGSFGGENMLNIGFSMKVGRGNEYMKLSRSEMAQQLDAQAKKLDEQAQQLDAQDEQIRNMQAEMKVITQKLETLQARSGK
ncbi:ESPR-type extended signal peptide-containing protein [Negativicoccus succinicivorans]|uniref:ESPR-type extended signal peptide-containing protein n=1 Tax=Negativicoccus succinicivorans TaxID=620903 RepID=UPI002900A705|nr:ESPR-type extended signal peptide-containing protein [Negativicoccus succinicivorans]MDU2929662.1 ESPR-type extended signal peptide-containing protein [Negativicoccus succinicivorans]